MKIVFLILNFYIYIHAVSAGKCECREYRCERNEHDAGSCEQPTFYARHGYSCCKPYCTCRETCNPGESDEGRNGIPSRIEENEHSMRLWEMANSGTKDEAGSCPVNQTFCCPSCLCRQSCKIPEINIENASCGSTDVLCCTNQTRNWRCLGDEVTLVEYNAYERRRFCGVCSCRRTCSIGETQKQNNKCPKENKLCCKTCTCKATCTGNETLMIHGKCISGLVMCCENCKCKTGCDVTERDKGKDTCLTVYGSSRCCYP